METSKRYYWLKLYDDFFNSVRIKKLRRLAGGDTYTIIYLKMQLKAMKKDGILTWTGVEDDFVKELALDIDEQEDDVRATLLYLLTCGLAETSDNVNFFFPYSIENTGSETASTQRSRMCRARQKMLQCNTNATDLQQPCNVEKEIEKEKEKEIETRIPTLEEVETFIHNFGLAVDTKYFYEYYSKAEWKSKDGKPIEDWKAVCKGWDKREREKPTQAPTPVPPAPKRNFMERQGKDRIDLNQFMY